MVWHSPALRFCDRAHQMSAPALPKLATLCIFPCLVFSHRIQVRLGSNVPILFTSHSVLFITQFNQKRTSLNAQKTDEQDTPNATLFTRNTPMVQIRTHVTIELKKSGNGLEHYNQAENKKSEMNFVELNGRSPTAGSERQGTLFLPRVTLNNYTSIRRFFFTLFFPETRCDVSSCNRLHHRHVR